MIKELPISVYRTGKYGDCTNGGISSKYNELLVICDDGHITVDENDPPKNLVKVVKRNLFGRDVYHLEPCVKASGAGWMAGGNFGSTSDSRFGKLIGGMYGAVAIHDRQESWEMYDLLSR